MSEASSLLEMSFVFESAASRTGRVLLAFDREALEDVSSAERERFIAAFREFFERSGSDDGAVRETRVGRRAIGKFSFLDGRGAIFRFYARGGLFRRVVETTFVRAPKGIKRSGFRPFDELRTLQRLFRAGVAVPRPLGVLVQTRLRGLFYRGAVATFEITNVHNALDLAREGASDLLLSGCFAAGREARRALQCGVLHRDLHLGNILIRGYDDVSLIDFDRATSSDSSLDSAESRERLLKRFARSATKHGVPTCISAFARGLESDVS